MSAIQFVPAASEVGLLSITAVEPHRVRVSRAFTSAFSTELRSSRGAIRSSCLPDAKPAVATRLEPLVAEAVLELSASFVVLHELFHILNGHAADLTKTSKGQRKALAFQEAAHAVALRLKATPARSSVDSSAMAVEILNAYYLEVEADNSAL